MNQFTIIKDIVLILLVSLPIIFLFRKINLPSITGFLIAGMLIGPYGFHIISDIEVIQTMAEVGVILLLFTIGLEVNPGSLSKMKKFLLYSGGFQVALSVIIPALIFLLFKIPLSKGIFLGMLISLSSTAIVLKILSEKDQVDSPHGRITLGILVFQDLAVVPMFIILPLLGSDQASSTFTYLVQFFLAFGALALIIIISRFIMPKVLYQLAHLRIREAFTIGTVLLLLGTAYLTHALGLSFAIGAFIAGVILSDSDFSHQVTSEILPLKDIFNSIFFVSIGLLLNLSFLIESFTLIALVVISIILFKSFLVFIIIRILHYPVRTAVLTGLALAQVGEFSFVLAQEGMTYHLLESNLYNIFLASSIFTMLLTPLILQLAPLIANKLSKIAPVFTETKKAKFNDHVIIAGFGLNGRNLARVLKEAGILYVVIELNPDTIKEGKLKGENMIYGDITKEEILLYAGIKTARVIVFAISDPPSTKSALKIAKSNNPSIKAIVRTRYIDEIDELILLGADEIIPEEFETSLQIFSKVLQKYHFPLNIIMQQVSILRSESYSLLRKEKTEVSSFSHLDEILAAGLTSTYYINEDNYHTGQTLAQLNLRSQTDATIIAIVRGNRTISTPSAKDTIESGDTLVITGTHKSVDLAFSLLDGKQ
ncbi:MAG: cation:proton antiporter [Ignavibacteriaceae bacterium]|nr:cation:proton antiporter [Ignavibacteriaceae bacterium]